MPVIAKSKRTVANTTNYNWKHQVFMCLNVNDGGACGNVQFREVHHCLKKTAERAIIRTPVCCCTGGETRMRSIHTSTGHSRTPEVVRVPKADVEAQLLVAEDMIARDTGVDP